MFHPLVPLLVCLSRSHSPSTPTPLPHRSLPFTSARLYFPRVRVQTELSLFHPTTLLPSAVTPPASARATCILRRSISRVLSAPCAQRNRLTLENGGCCGKSDRERCAATFWMCGDGRAKRERRVLRTAQLYDFQSPRVAHTSAFSVWASVRNGETIWGALEARHIKTHCCSVAAFCRLLHPQYI